MTDTTTAITDLARYTKAMIAGSHLTCVAIEEKHGLHGYPPELVTVGLAAAADGRDAVNAVEAHIESAVSQQEQGE